LTRCHDKLILEKRLVPTPAAHAHERVRANLLIRKKGPAAMKELIDIYDRNRNRTGLTIPRKGAFLREGQYMLYVLAILQNLEDRILITQRALDKHWAAGWWEVTGGGVSSGETSEETIVREVSEEVGLDVSGMELNRIYTYENVDLERGDNYIVDIYRFCFDFSLDDVALQESEAIGCRLATFEEIRQLDEQGLFLHYSRIQQALEATRS
jgi:8-oxo-dGTP diphosphatase